MKLTFARVREHVIHLAFLGCAMVGVATTVAIVWTLISESAAFFAQVSPVEFLCGTRWSPDIEPFSFGVLPLMCGTLLVAGGAILIALPVGLGCAIYLSEFARSSVRQIGKPILEILAGIPTVVYGYFALTFITPYVLRPLFPQTEIFNAASAAITVAIMIIPTISSLSDDSLRAVPRSLREGAYALSATDVEVTTRVALPAAMSGVVAAVLLALARAIGETMAVALAAGMSPRLTFNPLQSIQTMTGYIVQVSTGDAAMGSLRAHSIFAVAMTLLVMTLILNLIARYVLRRFREAYE